MKSLLAKREKDVIAEKDSLDDIIEKYSDGKKTKSDKDSKKEDKKKVEAKAQD
ncbi:MAG: hypothetical protein SXQ77_07065 [Halobacteria archaeon]|nr:hypothetical protein [Halobacteria archaeon]